MTPDEKRCARKARTSNYGHFQRRVGLSARGFLCFLLLCHEALVGKTNLLWVKEACLVDGWEPFSGRGRWSVSGWLVDRARFAMCLKLDRQRICTPPPGSTAHQLRTSRSKGKKYSGNASFLYREPTRARHPPRAGGAEGSQGAVRGEAVGGENTKEKLTTNSP